MNVITTFSQPCDPKFINGNKVKTTADKVWVHNGFECYQSFYCTNQPQLSHILKEYSFNMVMYSEKTVRCSTIKGRAIGFITHNRITPSARPYNFKCAIVKKGNIIFYTTECNIDRQIGKDFGLYTSHISVMLQERFSNRILKQFNLLTNNISKCTSRLSDFYDTEIRTFDIANPSTKKECVPETKYLWDKSWVQKIQPMTLPCISTYYDFSRCFYNYDGSSMIDLPVGCYTNKAQKEEMQAIGYYPLYSAKVGMIPFKYHY